MNNIEWKDGAVCYAYGKQWFVRDNEDNDLISKEGNAFANSSNVLMRTDFQLNEIREGDFIPASELDTEQKYNDVVEVFGLFGFDRVKDSLSYSRLSVDATHYLASDDYGIDSVSNGMAFKNHCKGRQLTYNQLIAIGKLKRMMLEREKKDKANRFMEATIKDASDYTRIAKSIFPSAPVKFTPNYDVDPFTKYEATKFNPDTMAIKGDGSVIAKPKRRNKSKQAYDILKDLDYEYDLVKQRWFKKEWV